MQKSKLLHKFIFVVLTISMTFIIFTGCKNSASNIASAQQANRNSNNNGKNSDEMKKKVEDTINSLISAGTLTSDQGTKITETLTTRPSNSNGEKRQPNSNNNNNNNSNNSNNNNNDGNTQNNRQNRQNFNPLSKLVEDKTITQGQADAVMSKLRENGAFGFGRNNNSNGGQKPADSSNNDQQSNSSSAQ